jgi:hypothetical protein
MPRSRRVDPDVEVEEQEEAEAPSRRRRTTAPAEDAPVRRRRAPAAAEDDDDDDVEEEKPVRRRSSKAKAKEEYDEETGDEETDDDAAVIPISRGRKEIAKNRPVSEGSLAYFRWSEDSQLIKFLDNDPWSYDQHWVKRDGKQSFPCLGKGCPLCAIGIKLSQKIVYPVLNLTPPKGEEFLTQSLEVGPTLDETLAAFDADKKTGPLTRLWWSVSRSEGARSSGSRKKYNYVFTPVKDRDLEEDWEIDLDDAEDAVADAVIPDPKEVLGDWTRSQLQEIADEAMGH